MLHRHFDADYAKENITTLRDITPDVPDEPNAESGVIAEEYVPFAEAEKPVKRRGRPRKTEE